MRNKLSALTKAQNVSEKVETNSSGVTRYYRKFRMARATGPSAGSRFVTVYDPKTGDLMEWNEVYDKSGAVNRINLKSINGIQINSPHFPPTLKDIISDGYGFYISPKGGL